MSGMLKWACSFLPGSEVTIGNVASSKVQCGEEKLLCSIELTDPKASFTTYHTNEIKVSCQDGSIFKKGECEISIIKISARILRVYCLPKRSGKVNVQLDLGKWYTFKGKSQLPVIFLPSPAKLINITVGGSNYASHDIEITLAAHSLYNDQWSSLKADILDKYNNVVTQLDGDCNIQFNANTEDQANGFEVMCKDATIKDGKLRLQVKGKGVGKQDFLPTLTSNFKERPNEKYDLQPVHLQVIDAPISLTLSKLEKPDSCVAGSECKFQLHLYDVFGKSVPQTSTAQNNIDAQIIPEGRNGNLDEERIACKKVAKSSSCFVDVSFLLTKAGERHFEIFDNENNSKRQLSLKVEPDVSNVHWELVNNKEKTYKEENLTLTAQLLDRFGNEVNVDPSSQVELLLLSGPEDRLEYETASISGSTISIAYYFTKKGNYVVSLQCHGTESKTFSIIVEDAPVDPESSSVTWVPTYEDQPLFLDDKSLLCRVILKDVHGNNYEGDVGGENLTVRCGEMQAEIMDIQRDGSGSFKIEVSLEGLTMKNSKQEFWFAFTGEEITRPLVLEFDGVREYDDQLVTMESRIHGVIYCRDVTKGEIIGPDHSHLHNIKRVCELKEDPEINDDDEYISIKLSDDENNNITRTMFYKTLLHLLRALYYRQQAFQADKKREHWKEMATESHNMNNSVENPDRSRPKLFSRIKKKYATIMNKYHEKACDEFFTFFNTKRSQSEIDLHGLLVADENMLMNYERQLQQRNSNAVTMAMVQEEREKGDEAIRKLKERLDGYDIKKAREDKETWLEIIVGAGRHSRDRQVIRPKVEEYLRERNLEFKPVNKGALVVTYEEYEGREPCFGEYYCEKCERGWRNRRSWVGKWQACYKCYKKNGEVKQCLPLKQRQDRKWLPYNPTGARTSEVPHLPELCQKCKDLGRKCPPW